MWALLNITITYNKAHSELIGDVTIDVENVMEDDHSSKGTRKSVIIWESGDVQ